MTTTCPTCNSELLSSNGQTFCPACLLQQGMKSSTYGGGPRVAWKPPEIEQLTAAFPQLEIQQLLGVGGMGAVFKVRQKELDRIAALKVLPGEMAADAGFTERFLREARLLASLSHPHIVTVYEFGQRDGIYFLLMEFIDGVTLRQALRAEPIKKLGSKETLAIVGQLCDALQFAHDEGVVHRDIKPENILIDKRGRVKIADFGLARLLGQSPTMPTLTRTHQLMGTPAYMAPEQIEGLPGIDHRADIYSMGVVFYELLTGELPLGRFSPPSERAETDVRLDEVVLRTLAREPDRRYQQASQVKIDVEALRNPAIASSLAIDGPKKKRRVGLFVSAFALGALLTPFLFAAMWMVMEWRWEESFAAQSERDVAAREAASRANAFAAEEQRRIAAEESAATKATAPSSGDAMMSRTGVDNDSNTAEIFSEPVDEMPPVFNTPPRNKPPMFDPVADAQNGEPVVSDVDRSPFLPQGTFPSLTREQREVVNLILKQTNERYRKEEALHSIVSVDANGVQTTQISAFPDQLRAIQNEMWTRLDDSVPVETQKEFRNRLNLYTTEKHSEHSGAPGMGGYPGGEMGGGMGMPGGMMGGSPGTGPGLLGWEPEHYPLKIKVSRSGRWFDWSVVSVEPGAGVDTELDQGKAPTLPSALQRFYREPGPWMAVANARATYVAKDWMKLADHFTSAGQSRELLQFYVLNMDVTPDEMPSPEAVKRHDKKLMQMLASSPELAAAVDGKWDTDNPNRLFEAVSLQLRGCVPAGVDAQIIHAVQSLPPELLRTAFALWGLVSTVHSESIVRENTPRTPGDFGLGFELADGEVTSYTETGDTASATLTIPNKPPVPIRFKRESGQWKIDAIGSNERLLERLKQTKIWKQHAEIEAVLENAQTAYASKDWQKLTDCFTHTGRVCWARYGLTEPSNLMGRPADFPAAQEDAQAEMRALVPNFVSFEASDIAVMRSAAFDRLIAQACVATPEDVRGIFSQATEMLSEDFSKTFLSTSLIQCRDRFSMSSLTLSDLQVSGDVGSATLVPTDASRRVNVAFRREAGQWKFDMVMSPVELQSLMLMQFARRLDRLLPDVLDSYQKGAWLVASESFTTAGQLRWLLEAEARAQEAQAGLSPELAKRRVDIRKDAVGRTKHLSSVDPASMEEFDILRNKLATSDIAEIEQLLAVFFTSNPPQNIQARFMLAIADLSACELPFEPQTLTLKDVKISETDPETKVVASLADSDRPVCFKIDHDTWKIDSLGPLEQLQQNAHLYLQRQADSPRAVVETFREAMANGRFHTALNCMTADARNEWLGEMMIGCLFGLEADNIENTQVRFSLDEVRIMMQSSDKNRDVLLSQLRNVSNLDDKTISRDARRKIAIDAGKLDGNIGAKVSANLIVKFLSGRFEKRSEAFSGAAFGAFHETPVGSAVISDNMQMTYLLQPASPDQQPLELDIVQVDGLWKLNTIIDPALKPWPLTAEEHTPPAEATPVDGATGVP